MVEFEEIIRIVKTARGSSRKRPITTDLEGFAHVDRFLRGYFFPQTIQGQSDTGAFAFLTHFYAFFAYFTTVKATIFHQNRFEKRRI